MDVDYANDKGSYVMATVAEKMVLDQREMITWSDYRREDGEPTFGLLSQVSPDGRYVVSTVKDRSVFVATDDLAFSQLFFPFKGILVVYDRQAKRFAPLPGADDSQFVQSNPNWSPDGTCIVFARTKAYELEKLLSKDKVLLSSDECEEFLKNGKTFRFDLYRIPFNEGRGGRAEPVQGASRNGMSNYFGRFSPDGKWIVFCKANSFMLLQPDSELYIIPPRGRKARRALQHDPNELVAQLVAQRQVAGIFVEDALFIPNSISRILTRRARAAFPWSCPASPNRSGRPTSPSSSICRLPLSAASPPRSWTITVTFGPPKSSSGRRTRLSNASLREGSRCQSEACRLAIQACRDLMDLGRNGEAKAHLETILECEPDHTGAHHHLAVLLSREGKHQKQRALPSSTGGRP